MNKFIEKILSIVLLPIWLPLLLIGAIIYIFSPDDRQAIMQGIGKDGGYTMEDLEEYDKNERINKR